MTLAELMALLESSERSERAKRNLPLDHCLNLDEFPFRFANGAAGAFIQAMNQWREREPKSPDALFHSAFAALLVKNYGLANEMMAGAQALENRPQFSMRFGIDPPHSTFELPKVFGGYPKDPCFFFVCDGLYYHSFCVPLLRSIARHSPGVRCHVHLIDGEQGKESLPLEMSFTFENSGLQDETERQRYYNAVRFIRFAEALEGNAGPMWASDVDSLVTRDIRPLLQSSTADVAMRIRPGRIEPWNQASACLVMGMRSGLPYFRRAAAILKADLSHAWWGMDQYALFSGLLGAPADLMLLGQDMAGITGPGTFWFTGSRSKLTLMSDNTPYAKAFQGYAKGS